MYCQKCGTPNDDTASVCTHCGQPLNRKADSFTHSSATPVVAVPNYLVQSILVTLLCCIPFGIVAIVYAAQVNTKAEYGDIDGAIQTSKKAKKFVWISFGIGLAWMLLSLLSFGASAATLIPLITSGNY